jgi:hypothetical protein
MLNVESNNTAPSLGIGWLFSRLPDEKNNVCDTKPDPSEEGTNQNISRTCT